MSLRGKVAVVTGGNRGLGLAITRKLASERCDVIIAHAQDDTGAAAVVRALSVLPGKVTSVRTDISAAAGVDDLLDGIREKHGRLDVFVHNAATYHPMASSDLDAESCATDMRVALGPFLYGTKKLTDLFPAEGGRVVVVSSLGARSVIPGYVGLGMAKAALENLVRYLAVDLAARGVTVNAVAGGKLDERVEQGDDPISAMVAVRTPTGRLARREELADAVFLLCQAEAAALRGQVLTVDGGLSLLA
ncbi:SDR family oxidoreductase [Amycolatopsis sp. NPDC089917]|uniref:SDR family oxidoreductase n=1 Tax=Amycolatopsis sp. NPDC089917 TaxID=3155187 RepID=UPI003435A6DF